MSAKKNRPTPTGRVSDKDLVSDIAMAMIRKYHISPDLIDYSEGCEGLEGEVGMLCLKKAQTLNASMLGRIIVAFPQAYLYGQHGGTWLGKYESGPELLQQIAATALLWSIRVIFGFEGEHGLPRVWSVPWAPATS